MSDAPAAERAHHHHLEQARAQVIELLSRQAVERDWLSRSAETGTKQDMVTGLVLRQQQVALESRLVQFHPADVAFVLENLEPDARDLAWKLVRPERRGSVLLETSDLVRRALIATMPAEEIAAVVRPLDPDDIADLIGELPEETRAAVLARLDSTDQAEVRSVLSFPEGTVGAEMDLDFITVREDTTLDAVHRLLRRRKQLPENTNEIIVVNRQHELRGVLPLERLLLLEPEIEVGSVMQTDPTFFYTDDPVSRAVEAFERYDLLSAPVVNLHKQVVGRVTVDVMLDEVNERAQRQRLEEVGLSDADDLYAPVPASARLRWAWLAINLVTAFIASRVIGLFEHVIVELVALAALMPIVASIGGNAGNQTVALVIRGLALNQLAPRQLRIMLARELLIGAYNGLVWGSVLAIATWLIYRNVALSAVIAAAMVGNLMVAATVGVLAPVLLQQLGRDPVRGSSVILTAATDSMGFLIFLGLAATVLV
jgi:magnesium transporter